MDQKSKLILIVSIAILFLLAACTPKQPEKIIRTVVIKITATPVPEPQYGNIVCPECDGLGLTLWKEIGNIGSGAGKVYHGDRCQILDSGSYEGIAKFKLNCSGKIGWLRAEGVKED